MKKNILSKKISAVLLAAFCGFSVSVHGSESGLEADLNLLKSIKYDFYVRVGSAGLIEHNITESDASFGGMYTTWGGSVTLPQLSNAQVVVKAKMKLGAADCWDDLSTSSSWEKAWVGFDVPAFNALRIYGGHGMTLTLPGSFFQMTEEYGDGTRWGKDGLSFTLSNDFVSWGGNFYTTTTSYKLKEKLQLGSGINFDFKKFDLPLQLGISLIYNNGKNYEYDSKTKIYDYGNLFTDEYDYTSSIFAQYKPNKNATISAGYTINGSAMTTSSTFKRVDVFDKDKGSLLNDYKPLLNSHIFSLISKWKIKSGDWLNLTIEQEAEGAKSFEGDFYSAYGGLRLKQKIAGILYVYPSVQYFSIFNREDSSKDRNSIVIYPRFTLEKGHHYFVIGAQFENREIDNDERNWIFSLPFYYKFSL